MKIKKGLKWIMGIVGFLIVLHIILPFILVWYVNKTLDEIPGYKGSVGWIHVNLFRGAYQIHSLDLLVEGEKSYEPFFSSKTIDLSIEWSAMFDGEIVGEIIFNAPNLVFVPPPLKGEDEKSAGGQTGENVDWTKPVKDLMPLQINRLEINNGSIHYKEPYSDPEIDVYIENLNALATNLSNTEAKTGDLPSRLDVTGISIGDGDLKLGGDLNIIKQIPDFDLDLSFEDVDLKALNNFSKAYANIDVEKGYLNFYGEFAGVDGDFEGYIKPIVKELKLVKFKEDIKKPLKLLWESVVGTLAEVFENQGEDQFATKVPLEGNYENITPEIWPTIGKVLENAFIDALKNKTDDTINVKDPTEESESN